MTLPKPEARSLKPLVLLAATIALAAMRTPLAREAQQAQPSLHDQAIAAEQARQYERAIDRLYELLLDQPHSTEAPAARLRLARLLALTNDLPAAILQCQALRTMLPAESPARAAALNLSSILGRRLRGQAGTSIFGAPEAAVAKGITRLEEPTAIVAEPNGAILIADADAKQIFRLAGPAATLVSGTTEPTAATPVAGGVAVAGKLGITMPGGTAAPLKGTWGGKPREVKKVRAMAANSRGDLFVVDRDFEGLLRCPQGGGACVPWGPAGKYRTVKVGLYDLVYVLDDRQPMVRVVDPDGKPVASIGPALGATKLEEIADIAVDEGYGLYLLEPEVRRVHVAVLRASPAGALTLEPIGTAAVPEQGDRALRNPSAVGIEPSGSMLVAGRSSGTLLRYR